MTLHLTSYSLKQISCFNAGFYYVKVLQLCSLNVYFLNVLVIFVDVSSMVTSRWCFDINMFVQIIVWWYSTKAALVAWSGSGSAGGKHGAGGNSAAQHACSSLCDEVTTNCSIHNTFLNPLLLKWYQHFRKTLSMLLNSITKYLFVFHFFFKGLKYCNNYNLKIWMYPFCLLVLRFLCCRKVYFPVNK